MPNWLRNQLSRAFREHDKRSVIMLNRVFYKYRKFHYHDHALDPSIRS